MPIYEFYSPSTGKIYSFFARSISYADKIPLCPDGNGNKMKKLFSAFSITGNSSDADEELPEPTQSDQGNPFDGLDPKQANVVMKELENSMAGMDDENPDPKQMGSLMRKMCDLTGEKMDNQMEEVVRKLEEGMDPNALEDQMGDLDNEQGAPTEEVDSTTGIKVKKSSSRKVTRDPKLYEFVDFIQK